MKVETVQNLVAPIVVAQTAVFANTEYEIISAALVGALMGGYIGVMVVPVNMDSQQQRDRHWAGRWLASLMMGGVFGALAVVHFEWIPDRIIYSVASGLVCGAVSWGVAKVIAAWLPSALKRRLKKIEGQ